MNPEALATLSDISSALCAVFIFLIPIAGAGLALINTGLGRSRSAAHMMWCSLCAISIAALAYFVCGFSWQGAAGEPGYSFIVAAKEWNWIAAEPFLLRGPGLGSSPVWLVALFGMFGAGLAALIPLGAGADRWRLGAVCFSTCLLAGFTFPLFAHWVWAGGWLAQLGANYGLGSGFLDSGGSGAIQAVGGLTALSMIWILGPRRGKYTRERMPNAIPGHNGVLVLLGCFLALGGWLGLNCAGALLFSGIDPGRAPLVAVNTLLSASSSAIAAAVITRIRFGKPDASLTANGWIAGLVASSAGCALMVPAGAVATGLVAGLVVTFSIEILEVKLLMDDPGGVISVHAVGGLWGILAVAFFSRLPDSSGGQWLAQLVGIATLVGFVLPFTYFLNWLLNRVYPQRVAAEGERQGMDLYELGAGAYPEFMTHNDDFAQRNS